MTTTDYRIHCPSSGQTLGTYQATSPEAALDALARDAGYADYAAADAVSPGELVATEVTVTMTIDEIYELLEERDVCASAFWGHTMGGDRADLPREDVLRCITELV